MKYSNLDELQSALDRDGHLSAEASQELINRVRGLESAMDLAIPFIGWEPSDPDKIKDRCCQYLGPNSTFGRIAAEQADTAS